MARTWFGEIGPCCCLLPLLNLPAAFSQPHANHKGVPSGGPCSASMVMWRGSISFPSRHLFASHCRFQPARLAHTLSCMSFSNNFSPCLSSAGLGLTFVVPSTLSSSGCRELIYDGQDALCKRGTGQSVSSPFPFFMLSFSWQIDSLHRSQSVRRSRGLS